jgi:hypothetical protein
LAPRSPTVSDQTFDFLSSSILTSRRFESNSGPDISSIPIKSCRDEVARMSSSIFTCGAVPVLGILNQKNHQERDDAADGIHDKLPCIGKAEQWPTYQPDDD